MEKMIRVIFILSIGVIFLFSISYAEDVAGKIDEYENAIGKVDETGDIIFRIEISVNSSIGDLADILTKYGYTVPTVTAKPGTSEYESETARRNDSVVKIVDDPKAKEDLKGRMKGGDLDILKSIMQALLGNKSTLEGISEGLPSLEDILKNATSNIPELIEQFMGGGISGVDLSNLKGLYEKSTKSLDKIVKLPGKIMRIIGIIDKILGFISFFI